MLTPKEFPPRQQLSTVKEGIPAGTLCRLGAYHELFDDGDPGDQSEETDHRCFFDDSDSGTGSTNGQNPA